jgi:hypothetical protein
LAEDYEDKSSFDGNLNASRNSDALSGGHWDGFLRWHPDMNRKSKNQTLEVMGLVMIPNFAIIPSSRKFDFLVTDFLTNAMK